MYPIFIGFLVQSSFVNKPRSNVPLRLVVAVKPSENPTFNAEAVADDLATVALFTMFLGDTHLKSIGRLAYDAVSSYGDPIVSRGYESGMVYVYEYCGNGNKKS